MPYENGYLKPSEHAEIDFFFYLLVSFVVVGVIVGAVAGWYDIFGLLDDKEPTLWARFVTMGFYVFFASFSLGVGAALAIFYIIKWFFGFIRWFLTMLGHYD